MRHRGLFALMPRCLDSTFRRFSRLHEIAPLLSIACALIVPTMFPHESGGPAPDGAELEMVAAAVDAVPYRIGPWVGQDIPVPEAARRLLRPNAILSRRFVNLRSGETIDLAIVHCGDSRDMLGHYPPVCYPSNGWEVEASRHQGKEPSMPHASMPRCLDFEHGAKVELRANERRFPARVYGFSRPQRWADATRIRVFNFFVLPDGTLTADIHDVGLRTNWLGTRISGVAQVQILTDGNVPFDAAALAAGEVLDGLAWLFDSLGVSHP